MTHAGPRIGAAAGALLLILLALHPANATPPPSSIAAPAEADAATPAAERTCLTTAIYYESAHEPEAGQEAVARVILNRTRQRDYPATICGVVWQGHTRATGCQFSFTCDGSLRRRPVADLWDKAEQVARRMLALDRRGQGSEAEPLLNYHADYVAPGWRLGLMRKQKIGRHIFYARKAEGRAATRDMLTADAAAPPVAEPSIWGINLAAAANDRQAIGRGKGL